MHTIKDIENMLNPQTKITDIVVLGKRIHIWIENGMHISIENFTTPLANPSLLPTPKPHTQTTAHKLPNLQPA